MKELLHHLDELLLKKNTDYYPLLQTGLINDEIENILHAFKRELPKDLRKLYGWKNGQKKESETSLINFLHFLPLQQALAKAEWFNEQVNNGTKTANWFRPLWIPIFQRSDNDFICYDSEGTFTRKAGQLIEYSHRFLERRVIADSLGDFIGQIIKAYEKGKNKKDGYFLEDINGFPKIFYQK